jgi:hypothetical protein
MDSIEYILNEYKRKNVTAAKVNNKIVYLFIHLIFEFYFQGGEMGGPQQAGMIRAQGMMNPQQQQQQQQQQQPQQQQPMAPDAAQQQQPGQIRGMLGGPQQQQIRPQLLTPQQQQTVSLNHLKKKYSVM